MGILSPETEALLAAQASLRGETPDALVRRLLGAPRPRTPVERDAVRALQREVAAMPVLDARPVKQLRDELWEE